MNDQKIIVIAPSDGVISIRAIKEWIEPFEWLDRIDIQSDMRQKRGDQRKAHDYHQSKWGMNKPRRK